MYLQGTEQGKWTPLCDESDAHVSTLGVKSRKFRISKRHFAVASQT